MRDVARFYWQCFKIAFRNNSSFANDWQWLVGIPVFAGTVRYLQLDAQGSKELLIPGWPIVDSVLTSAVMFAITWAFVFIMRLMYVPGGRYVELDRKHRELVERSKPVLGVTFTEGTECLHHPVPGTTYIRVVARNNSIVRLLGCRAYLERVEFRENGVFVPLLHFSPVNLGWSGVAPSQQQRHGAIALEAHGIRQPIDVVKAGFDARVGRSVLVVENDGWSPNWLVAQGTYRMRILVTADRGQLAEILLCVEWRGDPGDVRAWQFDATMPFLS